MRLSSMMERQEMGKMFTKNSVLIYRVDMDVDVSYEIRIENGKLFVPSIAKEHLLFCKASFVSENRNVIPTWAQKAWKNKGATLGFYFHETNDDFAHASEGDKELKLDYVGMKMLITHPKGKPTRYQIIPADKLDRRSRQFPKFISEKCVGCGRCVTSCFDGGHQALSLSDKGRPVMNKKCILMHTPPLQKQISGIKGKIRGVYAVKTLHIWQIIFIFYAVWPMGEFTQKSGRRANPPAQTGSDQSRPAQIEKRKPQPAGQPADSRSCRYNLTEILFNFRTQVYRMSLAMPAIMRRPMW